MKTAFRELVETAVLFLVLIANTAVEVRAAAQNNLSLKELTFAKVEGTELKLDLMQPKAGDAPAGLIVWVHGGAWRGGSRKGCDLKEMVAQGWTVASVDYRLSTVAR